MSLTDNICTGNRYVADRDFKNTFVRGIEYVIISIEANGIYMSHKGERVDCCLSESELKDNFTKLTFC